MARRQSNPQVAQRNLKPKPTRKRSLNALAIAEQENPSKVKVRSHRLGEVSQHTLKHKEEVSFQDSEGEEQGQHRPEKRPRTVREDQDASASEGGNDSDSNEWRKGQADSSDQSDLDSEEAFGESDEEKFEGFVFRGSSNPRSGKPRKLQSETIGEDILHEIDRNPEIDQDGLDQSESEDLGDDAVDLATMLDVSDNEKRDAKQEPADASNDESMDEVDSEVFLSDLEDGINDPEKLSSLQNLIKSMSTGQTVEPVHCQNHNSAQETSIPSEFNLNSRQKLTVADLIPSITDPSLRKSLKLIADSNTKSCSKSSGIARKLDVPLPKRQQDRMNRATAYEMSKETLSRWVDTIKYNRRAEHLSFPLQDHSKAAARDTKRLFPTAHSQPLTPLESTVREILHESGLTPSNGNSQEDQLQVSEQLQTNKLSFEEVQARRAELRRARDLLFREEIRAKRIKKIKSKSYRRVHRKERERNAQIEKDTLTAGAATSSGDDQEQNNRRRAEERMGARHRESKWARSVKGHGRAVWDKDVRDGIINLARREDELKRRIVGKDVAAEDEGFEPSETDVSSDDDDSGSSSNQAISESVIKGLQGLGRKSRQQSGADEAGSALNSMKFMKDAEARKKAENDAEVNKLQREITGENSSEETETILEDGRRTYGSAGRSVLGSVDQLGEIRNEFEEGLASDEELKKVSEEIIDDFPKRTAKTPSGVEFPKQPLRDISREEKQQRQMNKNIDNGSLKRVTENPWLSSSKKSVAAQKPTNSNTSATISNSVATGMTTKLRSGIQPRPDFEPHPRIEKLASDEDGDGSKNDTESEIEGELPLVTRNHELIRKAFAGDDVLADFDKEKGETIREEDEKVVDTTLPGWGSWTGAGVSRREQKRNKGRFFTVQEGVRAEKRQDAKLARVVINEKRVKKVCTARGRLFVAVSS